MNNLLIKRTLFRKIISQWLKYSNLKSMITSFYDESKILAHILSEKCEGKPIELEIGRFFDLASMDSIGRTALGEEFDSQNKENHVFRNSYERLAKVNFFFFHFCSNIRTLHGTNIR